MKKSLTELLSCPTCRGELTLSIEAEDDGEVVSGALRCEACVVCYPIDDAIPNLLPPGARD